jgi:hypothetical protein
MHCCIMNTVNPGLWIDIQAIKKAKHEQFWSCQQDLEF